MPSPEQTKPCTRPGCAGTIRSRNKKRFPTAKYCSRRCTTLARLAAGWQPGDALTFAVRSRAGKKGAARSAETRHRKAMLKAAADVMDLFPKSFIEKLSDRDRAIVRVYGARCWRRGHKCGYRAACNVRLRGAAA